MLSLLSYIAQAYLPKTQMQCDQQLQAPQHHSPAMTAVHWDSEPYMCFLKLAFARVFCGDNNANNKSKNLISVIRPCPTLYTGRRFVCFFWELHTSPDFFIKSSSVTWTPLMIPLLFEAFFYLPITTDMASFLNVQPS
ncbi:hypothetical protein STEG23_013430 [Scotinomys teguina]